MDLPSQSTSSPPLHFPLEANSQPSQGIYYLLRHPVLWKPMRRRLPLALIISTTIITLMFVLTFLPQAAFLALFKIHGPLALFHAALAVLTESATLISFILENFVIEEGVVDIFDATLLLKREDGLVSRGRELKPLATEENGVVVQGAKDVVDRLGEYTMSPFTRFSFCDLFVWVLELPINFVPLAGPWLFLALQGLSVGPAAHYHYTLLLGLKKKEQGVYFKHHRLEYMGYGAVGLLLQTFPIVSTFVCFTNAIGAALWAVQVERVKRGEGVDRHIERDS
ncbi:hypothetical protein DACRYDRAFT_52325 [Dacryopinax primogenitus]|uniref:Uncharacterized protein n=1 Tax=Dacryopinax primogenitus (strain DJM 731) TaxID=1858805 RepID=M5FVW0_DACPD|nr:uncharacterized protein DACRYDRAFT_52325 [Dacryopinax primogenitus]EJU01981.1 hypothetical protein DACRYDRAFT_52325 [Dacryopinax primogenitus]